MPVTVSVMVVLLTVDQSGRTSVAGGYDQFVPAG